MLFNKDIASKQIFDPRSKIKILDLPEGTQALSVVSRFLLSKGESVYDPLWRYIKKVDKKKYKSQGASMRVGEYYMGMRAPNKIPCFADFRNEILYVGRKLTIPFGSIRGVMAGHGLLTWRNIPVFIIMVKVDGCSKYIPIHQCLVDLSVVDLADFLSSHMHVPLGVASNPLHFHIEPGSPTMRYSGGEVPLYEIRGMITSRGPDGRTKIKILSGTKPITIVDQKDPMGWIENWGIVGDNLVSIVARRTKSRYGKSDY